jgi:hypothetical protein
MVPQAKLMRRWDHPAGGQAPIVGLWAGEACAAAAL